MSNQSSRSSCATTPQPSAGRRRTKSRNFQTWLLKIINQHNRSMVLPVRRRSRRKPERAYYYVSQLTGEIQNSRLWCNISGLHDLLAYKVWNFRWERFDV